MELVLKRIAKKKDYTIGNLYINGDFFCNTLEDVVRIQPGASLSECRRLKVQTKTAIPYGTYTLTIDMSMKYKKRMPRLLNVPAFEGIRIHSGNTAADTDGCILVGLNRVKGKVINSRETFNKLMAILEPAVANEGATITIE